MPIISAVVGAIGAIGSAIGALGIVGRAIIGIGLNFVAAKIQQKLAKKNQKTVTGTQFERTYGENQARQVACGLVGIAGHDCYVNTYDKSNKRLEQVFVFSDYPCDGLSRIWAGGSLLTLNQTATDAHSTTYAVANGDYAGRMTFVFYRGTQTTANAGLITNSNPTGRWTADHRGDGLCYLIARMTYDQEKLANFPDFFFEIRGARLYDFRKDSTVGGSGSHRWGDYSTHEFSQNPIVMDYNYCRGFAWGQNSLGQPDFFLGMEMAASDLPIDKYAVAANICDEIAGGETRYKCSIMLDADAEHGDNIDALMTSCAGMVIDSVEGSWPLIGTAQPVVATFADADLIISEPVRFKKKRSMSELVNSVGGTYPEPANMWSPVGYDTQTNVSQVALDRRTLDMQVNFETVTSKRQANQLASIYYNENRFEATADVVLRPYFQDIKVGDWVRWNSARYGDRVYIVQARSIRALTSDGPRNVSLSLQERDASIYTTVGVTPPVVAIPGAEPVYLNELQDWAVIPVLAAGPDGRTYPAFRVSWSPVDDVTVEGVQFRWWPKNEPNNKFSRSITSRETLVLLQEGVVNLETYVFEHILIAPSRVTSWSSQIEATALEGGNDDLEVGLDNLNKDVLDRFAELQTSNADAIRKLREAITSFSLNGAVGEVQRQKMKAQMGDALAQIVEERRVRASDDDALAEIITLLEADFDENSAAVGQQLTALTNSNSALSQTVTSLNASVLGISAQGRVAFTVAANQSGVDARYSVSIRGSLNEAFKETGFFLELYTMSGVQRSRFAILADQFVVTDGGQYTLPLVFENGVLKLNVADIGTIRAALMVSPSEKTIFNLAGDFLSFSD
ncbi:hypothetical protein J2T09_002361 [Neorhizobium huautlense]|uniref:Tip attachment protein J central straight fiber domain-containing protein n=1 Tax=Neorhizobium huautlense TaxID=67774 RepID=A0ABT9PV64_9HYPH|nr:hypothetical protein [Neorhizobium huautlense]MDP9837609.1 hypothetical protein [Neorhizobium huautlense]